MKWDRYTPFRAFKIVEEALYTCKNACDEFERKHLDGKLFDEVVEEKVIAAGHKVHSLVTTTETERCMKQLLKDM